MSSFVIVNPKSRLGQTGARLNELKTLLIRHLGAHVLLLTEREGDGERLAKLARQEGASRIVVAGGDGTVSEVISGMLGEDRKSEIELGLLPMGTGHDFARMLGLGSELEPALARIANGKTRRVDAGRAQVLDAAEKPVSRCFLNIASLGLSGESARWLEEQAAQGTRGRLSYLMSSLVGLKRYRMPSVRLELDGKVIHDAPLLMVVAANGQYFAGGMQVAPRAKLDDGLFDVVLVPKLRLPEALLRLPLLLGGKHIDGRRISLQRGRCLKAESDARVWVEADGEPIGRLPARIELLEGAILLCGLP